MSEYPKIPLPAEATTSSKYPELPTVETWDEHVEGPMPEYKIKKIKLLPEHQEILTRRYRDMFPEGISKSDWTAEALAVVLPFLERETVKKGLIEMEEGPKLSKWPIKGETKCEMWLNPPRTEEGIARAEKETYQIHCTRDDILTFTDPKKGEYTETLTRRWNSEVLAASDDCTREFVQRQIECKNDPSVSKDKHLMNPNQRNTIAAFYSCRNNIENIKGMPVTALIAMLGLDSTQASKRRGDLAGKHGYLRNETYVAPKYQFAKAGLIGLSPGQMRMLPLEAVYSLTDKGKAAAEKLKVDAEHPSPKGLPCKDIAEFLRAWTQ